MVDAGAAELRHLKRRVRVELDVETVRPQRVVFQDRVVFKDL